VHLGGQHSIKLPPGYAFRQATYSLGALAFLVGFIFASLLITLSIGQRFGVDVLCLDDGLF
jgi:hypothetical protein